MRAAVVGAAGFIGSHLCAVLADEGADVLGIDRHPLPESSRVRRALRADWSSPEAAEALSDPALDAVFLLAGTASVAGSIVDPQGDLEANAGRLLSFLELRRRRPGPAATVLVSSAAVYGNPTGLPVTISAPLCPISPYGVSKLASELYAGVYARLYGLPTAIVRPFSVYGPGLRRQVVWDTLVKLHQPDPPALFGSGAESRDFVYVTDACRGLIAAAGAGSGTYNICTGQETRIDQLAERLSDLTGRPRLHFSGRARPGDPERWQGDCSELAALGWQPQVSLAEGLQRTLDWYRGVAGE